MTNEQLAAAGLLVPAVTLPAPVRVARGKGFVEKQCFAQTGSARDLRLTYKAANPKSSAKAINNMVNATLRGETTVRDQLTVAWVQACIQDGYTGSHGERGRKTACLRMVKVAPEPKAEAPIAEPSTKAELEAEIAKLNAKLAALASSK